MKAVILTVLGILAFFMAYQAAPVQPTWVSDLLILSGMFSLLSAAVQGPSMRS